ncbi:potassium transporter Kup [Chachezhania sediminis]|uniref:potassium transporter Kup n=1 Tax=Chachezhania sediminis TaxID=2599291 RepID=UPI00131AFEDD|nr:potassium transporter Kup [Chachezhania sediminis]
MSTQTPPSRDPRDPVPEPPLGPGPTDSDPLFDDGFVEEDAKKGHGTWWLALGAVGVVYGDIGTSPLYAFREALRPAARDGVTEAEILGVVSLLIWALILIVGLKYVLFLLRADNQGEGGILSLYALVQTRARRAGLIFFLGVVGASLFFGDAIITPAISVLSAVEGLELIHPDMDDWILPIAVGILVGLFFVQKRGSGGLAAWFGPITAVWFLTLAGTGLAQMVHKPQVLLAFDPFHAVAFVAEQGTVGFVVLGAVFLAVTGAEALYADLGHFGRKPIQLAWFLLIFPSLVLNYLGQGALVLDDPAALKNPLFLLVPTWLLPPLVGLATVATVIASQAVITGAFSMTRQAIQLGLLPRFEIRHTSEHSTGQIYLPAINWMLLAGVLILVLSFRSSDALAAAYGIGVSGTMVVTTALAFVMLTRVWNWTKAAAAAICLPLLCVEMCFLSANLLKLPDGGYVPVMLAMVLFVTMWIWHRGTRYLYQRDQDRTVPLDEFVPQIEARQVLTAPGTAIFLTGDPTVTPPALLHNLKHNYVLHEHVVVMTFQTMDEPHVPDERRAVIEKIDDRFTKVRIRYGFMQTPNVTRALNVCRKQGLKMEGMKTTFFVSRRKLVAEAHVGLPLWQARIYVLVSRLATDTSDYYHLPRDRVVEVGLQMPI